MNIELPKREDVIGGDAGEPTDRNSWMQALRSLEATQARTQQDAERVYDERRREVVLELVPVLDNLERILGASEAASDRALVDGLRMVLAQLEGVLERFGVERLEATGMPFDPAIHDAVAVVPGVASELEGHVVHQVAPGYFFRGKMLRAAKVSVGVAPHAIFSEH